MRLVFRVRGILPRRLWPVRSGVSDFVGQSGEEYGKYVVGEPVVLDAIDILDRHCVVWSVSGVRFGETYR
jgi:hypothetical protein